MVYNTHFKVVEGEAKTNQRKQAFVDRGNAPVVLDANIFFPF